VHKGKNSRANNLPTHIAIAMDGNGRWAGKRGLPRHAGHSQGAKTAENIVQHANFLGIKYITLYAFSSENWNRDPEEVKAVMGILDSYLKNDPNELVKNNIRIKAIGGLTRLPAYLQKTLQHVLEKTLKCDGMTITLALSYGSLGEVASACQTIAKKVQAQTLKLEKITEQTIQEHLFTCDIPNPDLFIRPGGEVRLSNFLLLQFSYSELYFCKKMWPDFQISDFSKAIASYQQRMRRFGK